MNFDNSFPRRVALARNSLGLTQAELAKKVGVVHRQIAAYEGGEARPRDKVLNNLAAVLGTSSDWLKCGVGDGPNISNMRKTVTVREIPLLSWVQAISIAADDSTLDGSISDFIPAPIGAGEKAFAITILGNSMDSPSGLSFPEGTIVCFDPDVEVKNGDFVLCSQLDGEATFKQLIFDQGKRYLRPLNREYMNCEIDESCKIIAVAIHSQMDLRGYKNHEPQPIINSDNELLAPITKGQLKETLELMFESLKKDFHLIPKDSKFDTLLTRVDKESRDK
ncbi:TPA: LexA family protein [Yersinia enterocolitica]|uniref:LexA family protein n=1 Tax=Yersinia TaxID=629 RepID=UPI0005E93454|nr:MULTISPECIES: XRE family transcriptional regulator [Yersinia]ELI8334439.1 helix-turn-helix domain-containing protein [Yersinia enterocolitica]ELW8199197.1 helix-turn-helix domain-containing protein [Yersinia enterocolitica]CNL29150.1 prophage repressor protein [Yersinia enterocolitica]CQR03844.1 prophage repressor protein [Yersinia mollaretii]HEC1650069.1 helix-turn-helix domain-containing protein [Yersinia enterocolitica]